MQADAERAASPEDLSRLIIPRLNAGDLDGLVALYEPDAVLALPGGGVATGSTEIRQAYEQFLAARPADADAFTPGTPRPTVQAGDLALTSTLLTDGTVTVEVARRQADGTWLWTIDQPVFLP